MPDEVDQIVEAWGRERPDLNLEPLEVFSRLTRLAKLLDRMRKEAFSVSELESWEFDVLAALRRSGEPYSLSPGALIKHTMVTSGTMTHRLDRLSARDFVIRAPDPHDRRGVLATLTGPGKSAVDAAFAALVERERQLLEDLGEDERTVLATLLKKTMAPLTQDVTVVDTTGDMT